MVEALIEQAAMDTLAELAAQVPADQAIVEIGTHHAANLVNMARAAKTGNGATCYGIDPYGHGDIYRGRPHMLARYSSADHQIAQDNIRANHLVRQTQLILKTSTQAAQDWDGPPVALLVIDGEHRHNIVLADYHAWAPHLTPNATIAFDDYGGDYGAQVITAVNQLVTEGHITKPEVVGTRLAVTRLTKALPSDDAGMDTHRGNGAGGSVPRGQQGPAAGGSDSTEGDPADSGHVRADHPADGAVRPGDGIAPQHPDTPA